jgi:hypothetical protein
MNDEAETEGEAVAEARAAPSQTSGISVLALVVRTLARIWVVLLLLTGAGFVGVAVTQVFQQQAQLKDLRGQPGANAYAVLAYRAELQRQIQAISSDRQIESVPAPPARPVLLEEIDLARARNGALSQAQRSETLGAISAPP